MQLRYLTSLLQATEGLCKVTSIVWSPNNKRLAVVTIDRVVHLFDASTGERKDKFSTKGAEKGDKNYLVRSLQFSPDSSKLAVAQSDNIVFIYKIGLEWGDKKSICNKFQQSSSITSLTWPNMHPNEIVFGLADGKVKMGQLRVNKAATLYATGSYVSVVTSDVEGSAILSGHYDGSIYRFIFDDINGGGPSTTKIATHCCVPYALSWGESIVAAGNDKKVTFYDRDGRNLKCFDYSAEENCGEFTSSVVNPSGDSVVVGNFNCFYVYNYVVKRDTWELVGVKRIENLYSVTALAWKNDGSRLAVGSVCGALDLYDACVRRYRYKGKFEFTYVSLSQVIIKRLANGARMVLRSTFGCEITKLNIFQDRYLVGNTTNTLLVGDLNTSKMSEVQWQSTGNEKYMFDCENAIVVYQAGELSLIEYGANEILGSVRTVHLSPHLLSVRIVDRITQGDNQNPDGRGDSAGGSRSKILDEGSLRSSQNNLHEDVKKIAFLLDLQTISIKDLAGHRSISVNHDSKIDWLELNIRGTLLLFRDCRRQLHLFDTVSQTRSTLLNYCNYVQWVPDSDVVVAQNRSNLSVWYNIRCPDKATIYQIKGDVEQIERGNGRTEVIVDEGMNTASYQLDEPLIAFGTAIDELRLVNAMSILEPLQLTPEVKAMWSQLCDEALAQNDHRIAERCAAALGDVARCRYLRKINKIEWEENQTNHQFQGNGLMHWKIRSKLSILKNDYRVAEHILLSQGQVDSAIEMYQYLHKWEDAIRVAESKSHNSCDQMKKNYYEYLLETRQEEQAAALKVREGDYATAVSLLLKGGLPAKAAQLLQQRNVGREHKQLQETVAEALYTAGMFEKAGDQFEKMEQETRALAAYIKANAFRKAVELSRKSFPDKVLRLEEAWGDYLVSQKQMDMAINHYIEGNVPAKAVESAINSRQWAKAEQLVETLDSDIALPYYRRLARHYQDAQNFEQAERCFVKADSAQDAVEMYTRANKWDAAYQVALNHMDKHETRKLYVEQAHRMERQGKLKEAEKLFLTVDEPDLAINMYKNQGNYEQMIRLVNKYRKDLLKETHDCLAQQLEHEGNYKEAEHHYIEAGQWQKATNMYRSNDMWDEAIRVAKVHGGVAASKRVAYAWAMDLSGEQGAKLLIRLGLVDSAIDFAIENNEYNHAFELARNCGSSKLPEVHLKHALYLEDDERFAEAEEEFIKAGKPREALEMYIHQQDWASAMRVAESYDPASIPDVYVAQARLWTERGEHQRAEALFLSAGKPELALSAYMEGSQWQDAIRIAKRHLPHKLMEVNMSHQRAIFSGGPKTKEAIARVCEMWVECQQYVHAIDAYLSISLDQLEDADGVEEMWANAVELASKYDRVRYKTIVEEAASRSLGLSHFETAANYFKSIGKMSEALDCYLRANAWVEAQKLCEQHAPELLPRLERAQQASAFGSDSDTLAAEARSSYTPTSTQLDMKSAQRQLNSVEVEQKSTIRSTPAASTSKLAADDEKGSSALDAWMQRGEWDKVLSSAAKHSAKTFAKYFVLRCAKLSEHNEFETATKVLLDYGIPLDVSALEITEKLTRQVLSCDEAMENAPSHPNIVEGLSSALRKLVKELRGARVEFTQADIQKFETLLLITHYHMIKYKAKSGGLEEIYAKVCMSLLRYVGLLPTDKMFYIAGSATKKQQWLSAAFVYFNRYLDLCDAIEDNDAGNLDNTDFLETDIPPPSNRDLPTTQYLGDEAAREEIRDWVLTISMDQQIAEKLPEKPCAQCNSLMYEAALHCGSCKTKFEPCIITGFPVTPKSTIHCTTCKVIADKDTWNKWVKKFGNCPWCNAPQKMGY